MTESKDTFASAISEVENSGAKRCPLARVLPVT
jgi:hypothetical protein